MFRRERLDGVLVVHRRISPYSRAGITLIMVMGRGAQEAIGVTTPRRGKTLGVTKINSLGITSKVSDINTVEEAPPLGGGGPPAEGPLAAPTAGGAAGGC